MLLICDNQHTRDETQKSMFFTHDMYCMDILYIYHESSHIDHDNLNNSLECIENDDLLNTCIRCSHVKFHTLARKHHTHNSDTNSFKLSPLRYWPHQCSRGNPQQLRLYHQDHARQDTHSCSWIQHQDTDNQQRKE